LLRTDEEEAAIDQLLDVMAKLRSRRLPWTGRDHTLRFHAIEEVYELIDAIEAGDDHEMVEELGDLLPLSFMASGRASGAAYRGQTHPPSPARVRRHEVQGVDDVGRTGRRSRGRETWRGTPAVGAGRHPETSANAAAREAREEGAQGGLLGNSDRGNVGRKAMAERCSRSLRRQRRGWSAENLAQRGQTP
jgi:hypothetical protein